MQQNEYRKSSYAIPCSTDFRKNVLMLAEKKQVNAGDLARSIILAMPHDIIKNWSDPGEPPNHEREEVVLKSGDTKGKTFKRKPRLQVRMPKGFAIPFIRKALAIAIACDKDEIKVELLAKNAPAKKTQETEEEIERLRAVISVLEFEPLKDGIHSRNDALYVLGLPPGKMPDMKVIRSKYKVLATVFHPDSPFGSHVRMSQINAAMDFLKNT